MLTRRHIAGLLFGAFLATPRIATGSEAGDERRLQRENLGAIATLINGEIADRRIPGAVVLIERRGKTIYQEAFGWRDEANRVPMTTDTIFQLYSMTKPITSVAALMLVDDGKMRLDDPVGKYIPAFANTMVGVERKNEKGGGGPRTRAAGTADDDRGSVAALVGYHHGFLR
jgi:CubicO group peptidase (beta-lactamase class C family)